jgi:hypothetical protein
MLLMLITFDNNKFMSEVGIQDHSVAKATSGSSCIPDWITQLNSAIYEASVRHSTTVLFPVIVSHILVSRPHHYCLKNENYIILVTVSFPVLHSQTTQSQKCGHLCNIVTKEILIRESIPVCPQDISPRLLSIKHGFGVYVIRAEPW